LSSQVNSGSPSGRAARVDSRTASKSWRQNLPTIKPSSGSVGHSQPALAAVIGKSKRCEQVLSDKDESTGRDQSNPNGTDHSPFRRVRVLDGPEGHAHEVDRGIPCFRAQDRGSEPHPVVDRKSHTLGQDLLDRRHLGAGINKSRNRQRSRGLIAAELQGLLMLGADPDSDLDDRPVPSNWASPSVAFAQGTTSGLTHHNSETGSYGKFHILSKPRLLLFSFAT